MSDSQSKADQIYDAITNNTSLNLDGIALSEFRDAYNRVSGMRDRRRTVWIMSIVGDQALAQPVGRENILLVLRESDPKYYTEIDFDFMSSDSVALFGTTKGRYGFFAFINDVFSYRFLALGGALWCAIIWFSNSYMDPAIVKTMSEALLSSLSIFISIFVLFVLTVNPETQFRLAEGNRFHRLVQSDKYIAFIGVLALTFTILTLTLSAVLADLPKCAPHYSTMRYLHAGLFASAMVGTAASFWLVLKYHFGRRNEMMEIMMAKLVMDNQQQLYRRSLENRERE